MAWFVDDEEGDASEAFEFVGEAAGSLGVGEAGDPFGGGGEGDPVAPSGGLDAEGDGEVGLAGAGWAEEDDVVGFAEEVELVEVGDLGAGDGPLVGEVEVVEGLDLEGCGRL